MRATRRWSGAALAVSVLASYAGCGGGQQQGSAGTEPDSGDGSGSSSGGSSSGGSGAGDSASDVASTGDVASDAPGSASCTSPGALAAIWPLDAALSPYSLGTDGQGNLYMTGSFKGTVVLGGTTLVASGPVDLFLAKFSPTGSVVWAEHFGASNTYEDPVPVVSVDPAGDVFLSGMFSNTLTLGGTAKPVTAVGLVDAFAAKLDTNGQGVWCERFGYNQGPYAVLDTTLASNGDLVVAGTSAGTIVIGGTTWTAPDPAGSGNSQGFAARLSAADGSVVWSAASGGNINLGTAQVAVDTMGRTFLTLEALGGDSSWGNTPDLDGGAFITLRVGIDATGVPMWSWFDVGGMPTSVSTDEAGRVAVIENSWQPVAVGGSTKVFNIDTQSTVALLFDPADGTFLSGVAVGPDTFPWAGAAGVQGFTFVTGQYTDGATTFGNTVLPNPGPPPSKESLYVAQLDPTSHFVWAAGIGAGNTQPLAMTVGSNGRAFVVGNTDTAFTTSAGNVPVGNFVAVFSPAVCANDPGPPIPPGDGSHGDLQDAAPPEMDAAMAPCPSTQGGAVNGAACPVPMGCSYGSTCCFCTPMACNGQPTTWTCDPLGTPDPQCPSTPPAAGGSCPKGVQCNYCLSGGRYYADCTTGSWNVGYAQLLCQ